MNRRTNGERATKLGEIFIGLSIALLLAGDTTGAAFAFLVMGFVIGVLGLYIP